MHVIEVDGKIVIKTCEMHDYRYSVITRNDIVIPPLENDSISEYYAEEFPFHWKSIHRN